MQLVYIGDGSVVSKNNYTLESGSTILTLTEEYLKTFPDGTYYFRAEYTNGYAMLTLVVGQQNNKEIPPAGDTGIPWMFGLGMLLPLLAVGMIGYRRKRIQKIL